MELGVRVYNERKEKLKDSYRNKKISTYFKKEQQQIKEKKTQNKQQKKKQYQIQKKRENQQKYIENLKKGKHSTMSLVMQPLIIKEESQQDVPQDASSFKMPILNDSQISFQSNSNTLQLQNSAPTSTSLNTAFSNTSQQAYIAGQQTSLSGSISTVQGVKSKLNLLSNLTAPALKQQKSFNPTESYLSNYSTPSLNPTQGSTSAILDTNKNRSSSNSLGSSSLLSSFIAPSKSSLNFNAQTVISPASNTSTQAIPQQNTIGESSDISNFTNHIFSQPYLFYQSTNMNIPQLEASQDDLYTVFTFIVPNKPYPSNSTNLQLQKNTSNIVNNNINSNQSLNGSTGNILSNTNTMTQSLVLNNNNQVNNSIYTSYNSSNNLSSLSSNSNTPVAQHSSIPNQSSQNTSKNRTSPNGNQNYGEGTTVKPNKTNLNSNDTTPKVPHFGLSRQIKEERKQSYKSQSLVELIKQQCNPEEEKRNKSDSISTLNNFNSGFKSSFNSSNNLGSQTQLPMPTLSQSSITSLLNLSLNQNNYNSNPNLSGFNLANQANNSNLLKTNQNNSQLSEELERDNSLLQLQQQTKQELNKQENDEFKQESQTQMNTMNEEDEEKVVMPESIDEEMNDYNEEEDENNKKSVKDSNDDEDEEARLIREIKEMKRRKSGGSMFSKNFKKDGGFLFGEEDQDGDIFDFCEENLSGGGRKQKKNGNSCHKNKFDTKNLVKNFLNSFISFVHHPDEESLENSPQLNDFRCNLRNFFKGKKFNRVLLKEFIFEDLFRPLFLFFLENRALNWIESGRMKDKASHLRALKNFIFVCQNYDQIKSWRFRYNFVSN